MEWLSVEENVDYLPYIYKERSSIVQELRSVKEKLEALYGVADVVLAGGAPRDWLHGMQARDFDMFYYLEDIPIEQPVLDDHLGVYPVGDEYSYEGNKDIATVHEYRREYKKVQLVRCTRPPLKVVENFPINLSQVWMDCTGKINASSLFKHGMNSKTIQALVPDVKWSYVSKILPRYSEYAYIPHGWRDENESE